MSNRLTLQTLGLPRNQITCLKNTTNNLKKSLILLGGTSIILYLVLCEESICFTNPLHGSYSTITYLSTGEKLSRIVFLFA